MLNGKQQNDFKEDKIIKPVNGLIAIFLILLFQIALIFLFATNTSNIPKNPSVFDISGILLPLLFLALSFILFGGLKVVKPNEARVFTLLGKYFGVIKESGFFFVNPFVSSVKEIVPMTEDEIKIQKKLNNLGENFSGEAGKKHSHRISLKTRTLLNRKQKINDELGNPIEISIAVIWRVDCVSKALFNVSDFNDFLSIQCDAALRNIVRSYPYDVSSDEDEKTLRGSSNEISEKLKEEIQSKVEIAGIEINEARITHLAYAQEIAAAMLQRQQASAIIDARQMIVEGAVGMVDMALRMLSDENIVELDEERKAQMVSNLLVVLCANKDAQPIVNSGSLY